MAPHPIGPSVTKSPKVGYYGFAKQARCNRPRRNTREPADLCQPFLTDGLESRPQVSRAHNHRNAIRPSKLARLILRPCPLGRSSATPDSCRGLGRSREQADPACRSLVVERRAPAAHPCGVGAQAHARTHAAPLMSRPAASQQGLQRKFGRRPVREPGEPDPAGGDGPDDHRMSIMRPPMTIASSLCGMGRRASSRVSVANCRESAGASRISSRSSPWNCPTRADSTLVTVIRKPPSRRHAGRLGANTFAE